MGKPAVWEGIAEMDSKMCAGRKKAKHYGGYADTGKDGHQGIS